MFYRVLEIWIGANVALMLFLSILALRLSRRAGSPTGKRLSEAFAVFALVAAFGSGLQIVSVLSAHSADAPFWGSATQGSTVVLAAINSGAALWGLTRLRKTLEGVERGERMLSALAEQMQLETSISDWGLTARELQVVEVIASGVTTDRQIGEALFIAPTTVATHVHHILQKAGLSRRMDVMLYASDPSPRTAGHHRESSGPRLLGLRARLLARE